MGDSQICHVLIRVLTATGDYEAVAVSVDGGEKRIKEGGFGDLVYDEKLTEMGVPVLVSAETLRMILDVMAAN